MIFIDPLATKWCIRQQGNLNRLKEFWVETDQSPFRKRNADGTPQCTKIYVCFQSLYVLFIIYGQTMRILPTKYNMHTV